jgi:Fe2+ or Zn2+ uptake regulation protein
MVESQGLKMTPQRRAIVEFLHLATNHPTADEVLKAVNEKFPMTSRATVYNTLNWLKGKHLIKEVFESGTVRFDPNTSKHHHFICHRCGKVEDVEGELNANIQLESLAGGQTVEDLEVTFRGLCPECQTT